MKLFIISRDTLPADDLPMAYELFSPDSRDGQRIIQLYSVMQYPAYIVTQLDGTLVQLWQGRMPTKEELSYYVNTPV